MRRFATSCRCRAAVKPCDGSHGWKEPGRGSLSDRVLTAKNRRSAFTVRSVGLHLMQYRAAADSRVQWVSPSAPACRKPVRRFLRFTRVTGNSETRIAADGWSVARTTAHGCDGLHGWKRAPVRIVERSHPDCRKNRRSAFTVAVGRFAPDAVAQRRAQGRNGFHRQRLIAESRCAVFFVSPVSPARSFTCPDNAGPTPTWTRPPVSRVKCFIEL